MRNDAIWQNTLGLFCLFCSAVFSNGNQNIRLAGSIIPLEGRVEIYHQGEWGTVCSVGWSSNSKNTDVVCKQLGFAQGRTVNHNYPGTGTVWLDGVVCVGSEESILDCTHKTLGDTTCSHNEDVSVQCEVCKRPIISSSENFVYDWSFSASTYRDKNPPYLARLKSTSAWCLAEVINAAFDHYLEVELPRLYLVSAVATLGGSENAEYVESYRVLYSIDGREWKNASVDYRKVIKGNTASGNNDVQTRLFDNAVRAKFIRFLPQAWGRVACMRVDVCGHQLPHYPTVTVKQSVFSAILSWSKPDPGDEEITRYYVRYWETKHASNTQRMFETVATADVVISSLHPYTDYHLEIAGVSSLGEGLARVTQFKTLETVPSGSPTHISFNFVEDTAVNITWAPPDEEKRNGDIIAYVICFHAKTRSCKDPISVPGSQTWYVLREDDFSAQFAVEIRAQTKEGIGPVGKATSGVVKYSAPDDTEWLLIIIISCGAVFLALIVFIILAINGVILKNFVTKLKKLTSSKMTISTKSDSYKKHEIPSPYAAVDEETQQNIYRTNNDVTENLCDNLQSVRKQTQTLTEEIIYGTKGETLYPTRDQVVYQTRQQVLHLLQDQHACAQEVTFSQRNPHDALYDISTAQASEYPNNTNGQHLIGIVNTDHDNIYIYDHHNG